METGVKNRINGVDIARGIAMICIVIGHLEAWELWDFKRAVFPFHVPIFFLIVGWFIRPEKDWKTFFVNQAKKFLVPYVVTSILIAVFGAIVAKYYRGSMLRTVREWMYAMLYGAGDATPRLLDVPQIGAIWFLLAAFWGLLWLKLLEYLKPWQRPIAVLGLFLLGNLTNGTMWPLAFQPGCTGLLFIYIGAVAREWKERTDRAGLTEGGPVRGIRQGLKATGNPQGLKGTGSPQGLRIQLKIVAFLMAVTGWYLMWKYFTSFWLVHADVGKGILDIFGSLCACWTVLVVSFGIDQFLPFLAKPLALFGRYSLAALCGHIIELNIIPWMRILNKLQSLGMSESLRLPAILVMKFGWIIVFMVIVIRIPFLHRFFGLHVHPEGVREASQDTSSAPRQ